VDSPVRAIFLKVNSEHRQVLTELESKAVLRFYGIPTTSDKLATNVAEARTYAQELGYPVVLKICSPTILHKTEMSGVRLGLVDAAEVKTAFIEMTTAVRQRLPDATIHGVLVHHMVPDATEVIVGAKRDPIFGPVVMFGLGGVLVEVLDDTAVRLAPITVEEALQMVKEIRGFPLLSGFRGSTKADLESLTAIMVQVSRIIEEIPEISEIDLNPIFLYETGAITVDACIILAPVYPGGPR
jgi:acetyl-CoA synthetase (ADP-forming)